ncbi:MAG: LexA family transcriptional regulator [Desulfuromonadales bacterium]|nr:LexA family transcriptional regulator [Desulfuromonadales bacterium]
MVKVDSVIAKLKEVVGCRTDVELAKAIGTSSSTISTWKAREAIPYDLVARVADERHIPFTWFFAEDSSVSGHPGGAASGVPVPLLSRMPDDLPSHLRPEDVSAHLCLPGIATANAFAVIAADDSLAPRIKEGDYVIIATGETPASGDTVVASNGWGDILVRRYREKEGEISLAADHPEYPTITVESELRIHGKVIDIWRRIKV